VADAARRSIGIGSFHVGHVRSPSPGASGGSVSSASRLRLHVPALRLVRADARGVIADALRTIAVAFGVDATDMSGLGLAGVSGGAAVPRGELGVGGGVSSTAGPGLQGAQVSDFPLFGAYRKSGDSRDPGTTCSLPERVQPLRTAAGYSPSPEPAASSSFSPGADSQSTRGPASAETGPSRSQSIVSLQY